MIERTENTEKNIPPQQGSFPNPHGPLAFQPPHVRPEPPQAPEPPEDVKTGVILWITVLFFNLVASLAQICNRQAFQDIFDRMNTSSVKGLPEHMSTAQLTLYFQLTTGAFILLLGALILWLIRLYSKGKKGACITLILIGGYTIINSALGFFAPASAWEALPHIAAGVASFGAILCSRTPSAAKFFGMKHNSDDQ